MHIGLQIYVYIFRLTQEARMLYILYVHCIQYTVFLVVVLV